MSVQWIVVADASRARVLSASDGASALSLVHELDYPSARKRTRELVSDESGRIDKGGRGVLSAMDPPTDPHERQARQFAQVLADLLDTAADRHVYTRLTGVAPAHFLGLLKRSISVQTGRKVVAWFSKDLTRLKWPDLFRHVWELIHPALGVSAAS